MATMWASRNSLPSASEQEAVSTTYVALRQLSDAARGLTLAQGQADILGAIEMLCALQYHYQNFLKIIRKKIDKQIDVDSPDERLEAVAYITRIGQFYYFSKSPFIRKVFGNDFDDFVPMICRLLPFRHKYAAHRERDMPRNIGEANELGGELALGALGGLLFAQRSDETPALPNLERPQRHDDTLRLLYQNSYVVFPFYGAERLEFILEVEHPMIVNEAVGLMNHIIGLAKKLPRD